MTTSLEFVPVSKVAGVLKTTPMNVMMHIKRGLLQGKEIDGAWYVAAASLADFQREQGESAAGSLCKSHCQHGCSSTCS